MQSKMKSFQGRGLEQWDYSLIFGAYCQKPAWLLGRVVITEDWQSELTGSDWVASEWLSCCVIHYTLASVCSLQGSGSHGDYVSLAPANLEQQNHTMCSLSQRSQIKSRAEPCIHQITSIDWQRSLCLGMWIINSTPRGIQLGISCSSSCLAVVLTSKGLGPIWLCTSSDGLDFVLLHSVVPSWVSFPLHTVRSLALDYPKRKQYLILQTTHLEHD